MQGSWGAFESQRVLLSLNSRILLIGYEPCPRIVEFYELAMCLCPQGVASSRLGDYTNRIYNI